MYFMRHGFGRITRSRVASLGRHNALGLKYLRLNRLRPSRCYAAGSGRITCFDDKRRPLETGALEVTQFVTRLAVEGHVSASTQNLGLSSLLFLYREASRWAGVY
jgi:hypothetical protein